MDKNNKKNSPTILNEILESISRDRTRTNLLKKYEQKAIALLVQKIPSWISSNMLTAVGFTGSFIVFSAFVLATYFSNYYLLLGIPGFAISWFGDSLDGRIAYYRKKPRKNYGFVLDITIDWISIIVIGGGYILYSEGIWEMLGYIFVVMYGWEMIIVVMRYKITGDYSIDAGKFSPTEARILISAIMILEVIIPGSLGYSTTVLGIILFIINIFDTHKLLQIADGIDKKAKGEI
ncbi:MAG: CDP-alcohol phosphatidyltransferase family protein [Bacteroidota bacterium]